LDIGLYRGAAFALFVFALEKLYARCERLKEEADEKAASE
jgi:hypothetical protein